MLHSPRAVSRPRRRGTCDAIAPRMTDAIKPPEQSGAIGYILAWLIGIPIPILLAIFLIRGCN